MVHRDGYRELYGFPQGAEVEGAECLSCQRGRCYLVGGSST